MTVRTERKREHKRVAVALAISLLIHLLLLLVAVIALTFRPEWKKHLVPKIEPGPTELTIIPPPEPPEPEKKFFDSAEGQVSEKAPDNALFESDQNTAAASERPALSNEPIPMMDGEDEIGLTLVARDLSLGPSRQPSPPAPATSAQPPQPTAKEPAKKEPESPKKDVQEAKATPTPNPTLRPEDSELVLLDPTKSKPRPPEPKEEVRKPEDPRRTSKSQPPGFQPQTRVTRLTGGISNRGRASMDAVATPLGRYKKMISDAIGSRWYYYVNDMLDLVNVGTVQLRFVVRADGKVEGIQVLRNNSNESLASCSVRAIIEAEIPPIPKEVVQTLAGSKLEVDYSFTIIGR